PQPRRRPARRGPRLPRRAPGRQGDVDHLVSDPQEADRARDRRAPARGGGREAAHGDDRRGGASPGLRHGRPDAVLQPAAQDRHASLARVTMGPKGDAAVRAPVEGYDAAAPLERAWTIPASWYVDPRIAELENRTTFRRTWQLGGRPDQVARPGEFLREGLP